MPWLFVLSGHVQPLYWLHRINRSLSSMREVRGFQVHVPAQCCEMEIDSSTKFSAYRDKLKIHFYICSKQFKVDSFWPANEIWHYYYGLSQWLVACLAANHCLNQCWLIVIWVHETNVIVIWIKLLQFSFKKNAFENVTWWIFRSGLSVLTFSTHFPIRNSNHNSHCHRASPVMRQIAENVPSNVKVTQHQFTLASSTSPMAVPHPNVHRASFQDNRANSPGCGRFVMGHDSWTLCTL